MDLIADVGGTNTRCALVDDAGDPRCVGIFENAAYSSLIQLLRAYLAENDARPGAAGIAVAAPISGDSVRMTNRPWHFSAAELRHELDVTKLTIINDFQAVALALPRLGDDALVRIGRGAAIHGKAMAVIGAGTGLGVSGLIPGAGSWAAIAGEGGHVTLAPGNDREAAIVAAVTRRFGHCSAERLVSGPGLALCYDILRELSGANAVEIDPPEVQRRADAGDPVAEQTLDVFFGLLGSVAGNLALTLGAVGGVFVGGGIVPKMLDRFVQSDFRSRFESKGRYTGYLQSIPTSVITHPTPALLGLASLV